MLKSYDDGKEKPQSCEVWSDDFSAQHIPAGYGATQEEALKAFQENADRYIRELQDYNQEVIKGKNFNWQGKPEEPIVLENVPYEKMDVPLGSSIEAVVEKLLLHRKNGRLVSAKFNDKILYSDTVTLESAYLEITGKPMEEYNG